MWNLKFLASTVPGLWRGSQNSKTRSCDPFTICRQGGTVTPILTPLPQFSYSLYNFHGATMTMRCSLQISIATVKAFLTQNFPSPVKNWPKIFFLGGGENGVEMWTFVFGPAKGTSLRETTSFDVQIVKIGAGASLYDVDRTPKKQPSHFVRAGAHGAGSKNPLSDRNNIITHTPFYWPSIQGFRGPWGVKFPSFPLISSDFWCRT